MSFPGFVDCHSHVCPSGDDGAATVADGAALTREAARHGTALLFATPHVWPHLSLTAEREARIRSAFAELRPLAGLELRLGFELTPDRALLADDPSRYRLEGTDCVLMEVPFDGPVDVLLALVAHVEAAGLRPIVAHPERAEAVLADAGVARELAARGLALQVNASSLLGRHGPASAEAGWELVERGEARLVASDGHRPARPPHLDEAWRLVAARIGPERARPLFDGSALGIAPAARRATA
ncbi:MAG TPA: CpsB/CapC family capsule biosynthesis tyrosine phosphatase [Gaiellaceae bacterium]|nr:CpsB/CapC family capsule biosynthesis tyrosine phosphatase [Gaiellaceae bacterium]